MISAAIPPDNTTMWRFAVTATYRLWNLRLLDHVLESSGGEKRGKLSIIVNQLLPFNMSHPLWDEGDCSIASLSIILYSLSYHQQLGSYTHLLLKALYGWSSSKKQWESLLHDRRSFGLLYSDQLNVSQEKESGGHHTQCKEVLPQIPIGSMSQSSFIQHFGSGQRTNITCVG